MKVIIHHTTLLLDKKGIFELATCPSQMIKDVENSSEQTVVKIERTNCGSKCNYVNDHEGDSLCEKIHVLHISKTSAIQHTEFQHCFRSLIPLS